MNNAMIVREKVVRLVPLLAERKIKVTQRGTDAYVEYDAVGNPKVVNIPYIPDEATTEFLAAVEGFLDHEVGHVLFSDHKAIAKAKKNGVQRMHNILEDTFVERRMTQTFAGSGHNLSNVGGFFLKSFTDVKLKAEPENAVAFLMVPALRAIAGQTVFKDYMKDKWAAMKPIMEKIGEYAEKAVPAINSSEDALQVAIKFKELLDAEDEPDEAGPGGSGAKKGKGEKSGSKASKGEPGSDDDAEGDEGEGDSDPTSGPEEGEDSTGDGEGEGDGKGGEGEGEDDPATEDPIVGEEDHRGAAEKGEEDPAEDSGKGGGSGGEGSGDGAPSSAALEAMMGDDYEKAIAAALSAKAVEEGRGSHYMIYTKDLDQIEPMPVGTGGRWDDAMLKTLQDTVDHMVGPLQKDLERAVAARSAATWSMGHRSGRLHASALARLTAFQDDRAFRRKHVTTTKDVAVSLLVDCSGSMSGSKVRTAAYAAYGLSSVLDRMNINNEVLGFTTKGGMPRELTVGEAKHGIHYARKQALYIPILKSFSERLTVEPKKRFAALPEVYWLNENVDGESVQIAASRLIQRREQRKILIVLSDGQPACPGDRSQLIWHLKHVVREIEKQGVDVLGVGIQSDAPRHFYSKYVLLDNIEDLPNRVIGEIKRLLMK